MMAWHGYTIHDPLLVHSACKWKDCHLFNKKITFHVVVLFENYDQVFPSLNHKRHSLDTTLKILIECRKSISIISCLKYGVSSPFKESEIITLCFVAKCEYWSILGDNNIVIYWSFWKTTYIVNQLTVKQFLKGEMGLALTLHCTCFLIVHNITEQNTVILSVEKGKRENWKALYTVRQTITEPNSEAH